MVSLNSIVFLYSIWCEFVLKVFGENRLVYINIICNISWRNTIDDRLSYSMLFFPFEGKNNMLLSWEQSEGITKHECTRRFLIENTRFIFSSYTSSLKTGARWWCLDWLHLVLWVYTCCMTIPKDCFFNVLFCCKVHTVKPYFECFILIIYWLKHKRGG